MDINQALIEQIDLYLTNKLTGKALEDIKYRLQNEPAFKAIVEEQRLIIRSVQKKELLAVKKKLAVFHDNMEKEVSPIDTENTSTIAKTRAIPNNNFRWLAIAATLLFLVWGAYTFFNQPPNQSPDLVQEDKSVNNQEPNFGTSRKAAKIPIISVDGTKISDISLTVKMAKDGLIKYKFNKEKLILFLPADQISNLEPKLYFQKSPPRYFIKIGVDYYQLMETEDLKEASVSDFN